MGRALAGAITDTSSQVDAGLSGEAAEQMREQTRAELGALIHQIMDAQSYEQTAPLSFTNMLRRFANTR